MGILEDIEELEQIQNTPGYLATDASISPKRSALKNVSKFSSEEIDTVFSKLKDPYQQPEPTGDRTFLGTLGDVGVSAAKGVVGAGEAAVGIANIPTLGRAGKFLEETVGYDSEATQDYLSSLYSPAQQAANQQVSEAEGFLSTVGTAIQNPSTIVHSVIESTPAMLGGGLLGRGLIRAGAKIGPWAAGALGEGAVAGGMMAEDVRQQSETGTITGKQAAQSVGAGIGTSIFGYAGARAAKRLGIGDIDEWLAGGKLGSGVKAGAAKAVKEGAKSSVKNQKGVINRIISGGITEGIFEELPQSMQEQVWMNAATDKPLLEGVGESAALGMLAGAAMGGGFGIFTQPSVVDDKTKKPGDTTARPDQKPFDTGDQAAAEDYLTPEELAEVRAEEAALQKKKAELQGKKEAIKTADIPAEEKKAAQAELSDEEAYWQAEEARFQREIAIRKATNVLNTALQNDYVGTMQRLVNNPELLAELPAEVRDNFLNMLSEPIPTTDLVSKLLVQNQRALDSEAYMTDEPLEVVENEFAELSPEDQERVIRREQSVLALIRRQKQMAAQQPRKTLREIEADAALDRFANRIENHLSGFIEIAGQPKEDIPILEGPTPGQVIPIDYGEADQRRFDPFARVTRRLGGKVFPRPQDVNDTNFTTIDRQLRREEAVIDSEVNLKPTEKQKATGNYKKAKMEIDGLKIAIENPAGSTRRGTDEDGNEWSSQMVGHYGYFQRSEGKDGDQVDVFVKPGTVTSPKVFVVDQINPKTGKFDEHKVILGAENAQEAANLYLANYENGLDYYGDITELSQDQFKDWLADGKRTKKALSKNIFRKEETGRSTGEQQVGEDIPLEDDTSYLDTTDLYPEQIAANETEIDRLMDLRAAEPDRNKKNDLWDRIQELIVDNQKMKAELEAKAADQQTTFEQDTAVTSNPNFGDITLDPAVGYRKGNKWVVVENVNGSGNIVQDFKTKKEAEQYYNLNKPPKKESSGVYSFNNDDSPQVSDEAVIIKKDDLNRIGYNIPEFHTDPRVKQIETVAAEELSDENIIPTATETNQPVEEVVINTEDLKSLKDQAKAAYINGDLEAPQYMVVLDLLVQRRGEDVQKILDMIQGTKSDNLAQATRTFKAKGKADLSRLINMLGSQMYQGDLVEVTIKETVQNSFDAVNASLKQKGPKGIKSGKIDIIADPSNRIIAIRDNGQGMNEYVLTEKLFTLGGTDKSGLAAGEAGGGFGMAKAAFLYGNEWIEVVTIKDGKRYSFKADRDTLLNKEIDIQETQARPNEHGTTLVIKVPEKINVDGQERNIYFPYDFENLSFFKKPLVNANLEVSFKRDYLTETQIETLANEDSSSWAGEDFTALPIGKNFNFDAFNKPTKINFSWGSADLYIGKERKKGFSINHSVLSAGVYQFNHSFEIGDFKNIPYDLIVNIFPKTETDSPSYPFDVKREGFKNTVKNDVKALQAYLKQVALGIEAEQTVEQFKNIKALEKIELDDLGTNRIDIQDFITPRKEAKGKKPKVAQQPKDLKVQDGKITGKNEQGEEIVFVDLEADKAKKDNLLDVSMQPEKAAPKAKDFLIDVGIDDAKPIFHNNTSTDYFAIAKNAGYSAEQFFSEMGSVLVKVKDLIREKNLWPYRDLNDPEKSVFTGISIDKAYYGVNTVIPFQAVLLNPLALNSRTLPGIVHNYYSTILHEFAHVPQRNHGESFISAKEDLEVKLAEDGTALEIQVALARIVKKYQKLITLLRDEYESSTTKNVAKSLTEGDKGDGLAAKRAANESKGKDQPGFAVRNDVGTTEAGQTTDGRVPTGTKNLSGNVAPGFEIPSDANISDLSKPARDIPQEEYDRIHAQHRSLWARVKQITRVNKTDLKLLAERFLTPISTRLRNINPILETKVRWLGFDTTNAITEQLRVALPLMQVVDSMSAKDRSAFDWALKQRDINRINQITEKYGVTENYNNMRAILDKIHSDAKKVGLDVNYLENYWPRILKDREGFLQATQEISRDPIFTNALKAKAQKLGISVNDLDPDLRADIISNIILNKQSGLGGPGNTQSRVFDFIPEDYAEFYMDSKAALMQYIYSMNKKIEARKFFGKVPERIAKAKTRVRTYHTRLVNLQDMEALMTSEGQDTTDLQAKIQSIKDDMKLHQQVIEEYKYQNDYTENISSYVSELLSKEIIDTGDEMTLKEILNARFNERGTTGIVNIIKNISYIDTMGSPFSALTQIGDLAWAFYVGGLHPVGIARTTKNMIKAIFKQSNIIKEDLGFERIAQEFADADTMSRAVSKIFKAVQLERIDTIGKEALINTAYENYKRQAASNPNKLKKDLHNIFGKETNSVVEDLLTDNEASENVRFLLYSTVLDFQPMALSEMPEKYLTLADGRIFYMLKTFTIRQIDVFRREVFHMLRSDDPQEVMTGMRNLVSLVAVTALANAGADELKDLIAGKESKFEDHVIENLITMAGGSRYMKMEIRKDGLGSALFGQILPPFKFVDSVTKDVFGDTSEGLRVIDSIPIGGKLYYWHFGRGSEKRPSLNEQEFTKLKKKTTKFKEKFEQSGDKREFLRSNVDQFRQMKMVESMQGSLNKNKALINKLKDMDQTPNIQKRIAQLKQRRELMLENFFQRTNMGD